MESLTIQLLEQLLIGAIVSGALGWIVGVILIYL